MENFYEMIYPWLIAFTNPIFYIPFIYLLFRDMENWKTIMVRILILILVSNIFDLIVYGSKATPF